MHSRSNVLVSQGSRPCTKGIVALGDQVRILTLFFGPLSRSFLFKMVTSAQQNASSVVRTVWGCLAAPHIEGVRSLTSSHLFWTAVAVRFIESKYLSPAYPVGPGELS